MSDSDIDSASSPYGYSTPPLSPTKSISTDGWLSPKTPWSPRKSRNYHSVRHGILSPEPFLLSPPVSPVKPKALYRNTGFKNSEIHHVDDVLLSPWSNIDLSADDRDTQHLSHIRRSSPSHAKDVFHSGDAPVDEDEDDTSSRTRFGTLDTSSDQISDEGDRSPRASSESSTTLLHPRSINESARTIDAPASTNGLPLPYPSLAHSLSDEDISVTTSSKLRRLPLRCATSPLRSSQWATRGGLLSSLRVGQSSTPDRFIAARRPQAVTRESFELNKPFERQEICQPMPGGRCPSRNPFSRRLRRSGRLNEELRGLREAHSMITGRAIALRRNVNLNYRRNSFTLGNRQISAGAVWNVGGPSAVSDTVVGSSTGRGGMFGSGTNAPLYRSAFLSRADPLAEFEAYEQRLALALDVDQTERVLQHTSTPTSLDALNHYSTTSPTKHTWRDGAWINDGSTSLLDAPQLRDDFYCTLLAYSHTAKCIAVGLGNYVHLWSERSGVDTPASLNATPVDSNSDVHHVTSLDFSSTQGSQAILAVGRADGRISLWSPFDSDPRFDATQPKPVSCVSWRPTTVQRPSMRDRAMTVTTEELLIGDEVGHIYFYSIEWPSQTQSALFDWHGAMTLVARMTIHTQQICGLAWAPDGKLFASGGNDNNCFLFETGKVLRPNSSNGEISATLDVREGPAGESIYSVANRSGSVLHLPETAARHKWTLNAAIKAIAFCPWQRGLIAIGGGSNDRCIHFFHTRSGTCLATIDCAAQVTSLVWSQSKREIAATFGFAQPEHPYRIAVFAWPSCEQVVAVPWWDENRALCAVAFPRGPANETHEEREAGREDSLSSTRGVVDGCIVVAASDMAIRFHEIWSSKRGAIGLGGNGAPGLLGGSDILEGFHGIEREGPVIR